MKKQSLTVRTFLLNRHIITLLCAVLFGMAGAGAQTNTFTATSGNWSTAANWSLGIVPATAHDVVIPATASVTADGTAMTIKSLTVSGTLTYPVSVAKSITVSGGNLSINPGGVLQSGLSGTFSHTLIISTGNFINSGTFNAVASAANLINVVFSGAASNSFTTSATAVSAFNFITITKSAIANILDFSPSNTVSLPAGFLTLNTGTFELSGTQNINNTFFSSAAYTLAAASRFWLNNPNATVTAQAGGISLLGGNNLRISAGTYNVGTTNAHGISFANGTLLLIDGGTLNLTGALALSSTPSGAGITVSGGTANIGTDMPAICITGGTNSAVIVSDSGKLNASTSVGTLTGNVTVSGGSFNVGSTAAHSLTITSNIAHMTVSGGAINVSGFLTIGNAADYVQTGGSVTVAIAGNTTSGTASFSTASNSSVFFNGGSIIVQNPSSATPVPMDYAVPAVGVFSGSGYTTLQLGNALTPASSTFRIQGIAANVQVNNASGTSPSCTQTAAMTVRGNMTLNGTGTYSSGNLALTLSGNSATYPGHLAVNAATLTMGTAALTFNGSSGTQTISKTTGTINTIPALTINKSSLTDSLSLATPVTVGTILTLTKGLINTSNTNLLTLGTTGTNTLSGGTAGTSYINGPFARVFGAARTATGITTAATLFPTGKNGAYFPVYLDPTTDASGVVTVKMETMDDVAGAMAWVNSPLVYSNYKKLSRDWQVTYSGPGTVSSCYVGANTGGGTLTTPAVEYGNSYALVTNPSGSGTYSDGTPLGLNNTGSAFWRSYSAVTPSGTGLPSGARFTLASPLEAPAPGGLANDLKLWLKAGNITGATDASPVAVWPNGVAGFAAPVQVTPASRPVYASGGAAQASNFNPAVYFNGGNLMNFSDIAFSGNQYTIFAVGKDIDISSAPVLMGPPASTASHAVAVSNTGEITLDNWSGGGHINTTGAGTVLVNSNGLYDIVYGAGAPDNVIRYNGFPAGSSTISSGTFAANTTLGAAAGTRYWAGTMSEIVMYNTAALSTQARQQVQSYLALKYGLTLSQGLPKNNYSSSRGSVIWDTAAAAAGFNNDIFGIGVDSLGGLDQKVSCSVNGDGLFTLALSNDFTSANSGRTGAFARDTTFVTLANNDSAYTFGPAGLGSYASHSRIARTWQMQKHGLADSVYVGFHKDSLSTIPVNTDVYLLLGNVNNFTQRENFSFTPLQLNGTTGYYAAKIPATHLQYITVAAVAKNGTLPSLRHRKRFLFGDYKGYGN